MMESDIQPFLDDMKEIIACFEQGKPLSMRRFASIVDVLTHVLEDMRQGQEDEAIKAWATKEIKRVMADMDFMNPKPVKKKSNWGF